MDIKRRRKAFGMWYALTAGAVLLAPAAANLPVHAAPLHSQRVRGAAGCAGITTVKGWKGRFTISYRQSFQAQSYQESIKGSASYANQLSRSVLGDGWWGGAASGAANFNVELTDTPSGGRQVRTLEGRGALIDTSKLFQYGAETLHVDTATCRYEFYTASIVDAQDSSDGATTA
ncbi:MAG: hypothetical protein ACRDID_03020, partial [Ktedonobacterales bacterium]